MRPRVLITGANGVIGTIVRRDLSDKYEFSGLSRHAVPGIPYRVASITDYEAIRPAFDGMDMVLHLAGETTNDSNWDDHVASTALGALNVFRAAKEAGAWRVVFASTGQTVLGYLKDETLPYGPVSRGEIPSTLDRMLQHTAMPRPDSPYGIAKLFAEACARYFSDFQDMSMIVIRLGGVFADDIPMNVRQLAGYLSQADAVQLIDLCLGAPPSLRFDMFDAVSNNPRQWRDTRHAREVLGWRPTGSSKQFESLFVDSPTA